MPALCLLMLTYAVRFQWPFEFSPVLSLVLSKGILGVVSKFL